MNGVRRNIEAELAGADLHAVFEWPDDPPLTFISPHCVLSVEHVRPVQLSPCARMWVLYVSDLDEMPEVIRRSYFLIEPSIILIKYNNDAIMLARIVAPHEGIRRVFSQAENAHQLSEGLLNFLP